MKITLDLCVGGALTSRIEDKVGSIGWTSSP